MGAGDSLAYWLGSSTTAYVTTWYDQSGNAYHASQSTTSLQPKYSLSNQYVDFKPSAWMNVANGFLPSGNSPYSFVLKHGNILNVNGAAFGMGPININNNCLVLRRNTGQYNAYWWYVDDAFGTYSPNNVVSETYDQSNRRGYVNGILQSIVASSSHNGQSLPSYIGTDSNSEIMNGEIYYLFISNVALSNQDRSVLEAALSASAPNSSYTSFSPCPLGYNSTAGSSTCFPITNTPFSVPYTGSSQFYTVPVGISLLLVKIWGAGGGGGEVQ